MTITCLYRHFSNDARLLYVGISLDMVQRTIYHSRETSWYDDVTRIEIARFPSRDAALIAEQNAIKTEAPAYNIQGMPRSPMIAAPRPDTLKAILRRAGGVSALARGLGLTRQAISSWRKIPSSRLVDVERITGIPREELRPDVFTMGVP